MAEKPPDLTSVPDLPLEEPITADMTQLVRVLGVAGTGTRPSYKDEAMGVVPAGMPLTNYEMNQISQNADQILDDPQDPPKQLTLPGGSPYPVAHLELLPAGSQPVLPSMSFDKRRERQHNLLNISDIVILDSNLRVFDLAGKEMKEEQIQGVLKNQKTIRKRRVGDFS